MPRRSDVPYGPIIVVKGRHAGRIGIYDDQGDAPGEMLVFLYDGRRASTTLEFIAPTADISRFAVVRSSQVRVPTAAEAAAILTLIQTTYSGAELAKIARKGLAALSEVGVDAEMDRRLRDRDRFGSDEP